jgi:hypothetical protein
VSALDETRIHVRPLATRMPYEPVSFRDIPVPRFATTPSATLAGTLVIPPGFVVSHFAGSSAVHVRDLLATPQHSERWLLAHESPIVQIACISGMIVALLADDTLLMHDVHGAMTSEWTTDLKCGPLFRPARKASVAAASSSSSTVGAAAAGARSSRCLLVSEACLVIVADTHFFMWTWRSLLYVGTSVETMPAPSISFALDPVDEKLMPRADFSTLDLRGHVLLGGNQGFVLYDIAAEAPLFRYELSTAFAIASFHAVRWSGECVVTLEASRRAHLARVPARRRAGARRRHHVRVGRRAAHARGHGALAARADCARRRLCRSARSTPTPTAC